MFIFRVKTLATASFYRDLNLIADPIEFDKSSSLWLYRLNPVKAARVGLQKALSILEKANIYIPDEVKNTIESLEKDCIDVYLTLEPPDVVLYTGSTDIVRVLRMKNLVVFDKKTATLRLPPMNLHRVLDLSLIHISEPTRPY